MQTARILTNAYIIMKTLEHVQRQDWGWDWVPVQRGAGVLHGCYNQDAVILKGDRAWTLNRNPLNRQTDTTKTLFSRIFYLVENYNFIQFSDKRFQ